MRGLNTQDARSLSAPAQEALRLRVVQAVRDGRTQAEAARRFGVARGTVNGWMGLWAQQGWRALRARRRGRPPKPRLAPAQAATTVHLIVSRCPDQLRLPLALWTREAVQQLLARRFGLDVSVWTVGRYLRDGELTPQKPVRRAYEQNPAMIRKWLETEYPALRNQAKRENAEIRWGDEMGLRSDHPAGRSYRQRGPTPGIPGTGQRFGCNLISTITNRGRLAFLVLGQRCTARVLVRFLRRLIRHAGRKVFLIVDGHPVHQARRVSRWRAQHPAQVRRFWRPPYRPELNPDELLNQDGKSNAVGRRRPADRQELIDNVRSYLRSTQRRPEKVRCYFHQRQVRYAA